MQIAKKRFAKLLLLFSGLLLSLTTAEFAGRAFARLAVEQRVSIADDVLGWKLIPYARRMYRKEAQPYLIEINSKGLRDREHSYEKPPGIFRIVVIGDSLVFGSGGVDPSSRFTDILERTMKNVEVINMGIPAYSTDQEYLYLKNEGMKYHPDLVILCGDRNDFKESFVTVNPSNGRPKGYFSTAAGQLVFHPPSFSLFYRLSQRSYVLGVVDFLWTELLNSFKGYRKRYRFQVLTPQERLDTFRQILISAENLCHDQGSDFLVVYFPFRGLKGDNPMRHVMDELAATRGTRTLDLTNYMQRVNTQRVAYLQKDVHFNEYGHQIVADALQEYILTRGLLSSALAKSQPPALSGNN